MGQDLTPDILNWENSCSIKDKSDGSGQHREDLPHFYNSFGSLLFLSVGFFVWKELCNVSQTLWGFIFNTLIIDLWKPFIQSLSFPNLQHPFNWDSLSDSILGKCPDLKLNGTKMEIGILSLCTTAVAYASVFMTATVILRSAWKVVTGPFLASPALAHSSFATAPSSSSSLLTFLERLLVFSLLAASPLALFSLPHPHFSPHSTARRLYSEKQQSDRVILRLLLLLSLLFLANASFFLAALALSSYSYFAHFTKRGRCPPQTGSPYIPGACPAFSPPPSLPHTLPSSPFSLSSSSTPLISRTPSFSLDQCLSSSSLSPSSVAAASSSFFLRVTHELGILSDMEDSNYDPLARSTDVLNDATSVARKAGKLMASNEFKRQSPPPFASTSLRTPLSLNPSKDFSTEFSINSALNSKSSSVFLGEEEPWTEELSLQKDRSKGAELEATRDAGDSSETDTQMGAISGRRKAKVGSFPDSELFVLPRGREDMRVKLGECGGIPGRIEFMTCRIDNQSDFEAPESANNSIATEMTSSSAPSYWRGPRSGVNLCEAFEKTAPKKPTKYNANNAQKNHPAKKIKNRQRLLRGDSPSSGCHTRAIPSTTNANGDNSGAFLASKSALSPRLESHKKINDNGAAKPHHRHIADRVGGVARNNALLSSLNDKLDFVSLRRTFAKLVIPALVFVLVVIFMVASSVFRTFRKALAAARRHIGTFHFPHGGPSMPPKRAGVGGAKRNSPQSATRRKISTAVVARSLSPPTTSLSRGSPSPAAISSPSTEDSRGSETKIQLRRRSADEAKGGASEIEKGLSFPNRFSALNSSPWWIQILFSPVAIVRCLFSLALDDILKHLLLVLWRRPLRRRQLSDVGIDSSETTSTFHEASKSLRRWFILLSVPRSSAAIANAEEAVEADGGDGSIHHKEKNVSLIVSEEMCKCSEEGTNTAGFHCGTDYRSSREVAKGRKKKPSVLTKNLKSSDASTKAVEFASSTAGTPAVASGDRYTAASSKPSTLSSGAPVLVPPLSNEEEFTNRNKKATNAKGRSAVAAGGSISHPFSAATLLPTTAPPAPVKNEFNACAPSSVVDVAHIRSLDDGRRPERFSANVSLSFSQGKNHKKVDENTGSYCRSSASVKSSSSGPVVERVNGGLPGVTQNACGNDALPRIPAPVLVEACRREEEAACHSTHSEGRTADGMHASRLKVSVSTASNKSGSMRPLTPFSSDSDFPPPTSHLTGRASFPNLVPLSNGPKPVCTTSTDLPPASVSSSSTCSTGKARVRYVPLTSLSSGTKTQPQNGYGAASGKSPHHEVVQDTRREGATKVSLATAERWNTKLDTATLGGHNASGAVTALTAVTFAQVVAHALPQRTDANSLLSADSSSSSFSSSSRSSSCLQTTASSKRSAGGSIDQRLVHAPLDAKNGASAGGPASTRTQWVVGKTEGELESGKRAPARDKKPGCVVDPVKQHLSPPGGGPTVFPALNAAPDSMGRQGERVSVAPQRQSEKRPAPLQCVSESATAGWSRISHDGPSSVPVFPTVAPSLAGLTGSSTDARVHDDVVLHGGGPMTSATTPTKAPCLTQGSAFPPSSPLHSPQCLTPGSMPLCFLPTSLFSQPPSPSCLTPTPRTKNVSAVPHVANALATTFSQNAPDGRDAVGTNGAGNNVASSGSMNQGLPPNAEAPYHLGAGSPWSLSGPSLEAIDATRPPAQNSGNHVALTTTATRVSPWLTADFLLKMKAELGNGNAVEYGTDGAGIGLAPSRSTNSELLPESLLSLSSEERCRDSAPPSSEWASPFALTDNTPAGMATANKTGGKLRGREIAEWPVECPSLSLKRSQIAYGMFEDHSNENPRSFCAPLTPRSSVAHQGAPTGFFKARCCGSVKSTVGAWHEQGASAPLGFSEPLPLPGQGPLSPSVAEESITATAATPVATMAAVASASSWSPSWSQLAPTPLSTVHASSLSLAPLTATAPGGSFTPAISASPFPYSAGSSVSSPPFFSSPPDTGGSLGRLDAREFSDGVVVAAAVTGGCGPFVCHLENGDVSVSTVPADVPGGVLSYNGCGVSIAGLLPTVAAGAESELTAQSRVVPCSVPRMPHPSQAGSSYPSWSCWAGFPPRQDFESVEASEREGAALAAWFTASVQNGSDEEAASLRRLAPHGLAPPRFPAARVLFSPLPEDNTARYGNRYGSPSTVGSGHVMSTEKDKAGAVDGGVGDGNGAEWSRETARWLATPPENVPDFFSPVSMDWWQVKESQGSDLLPSSSLPVPPEKEPAAVMVVPGLLSLFSPSVAFPSATAAVASASTTASTTALASSQAKSVCLGIDRDRHGDDNGNFSFFSQTPCAMAFSGGPSEVSADGATDGGNAVKERQNRLHQSSGCVPPEAEGDEAARVTRGGLGDSLWRSDPSYRVLASVHNNSATTRVDLQWPTSPMVDSLVARSVEAAEGEVSSASAFISFTSSLPGPVSTTKRELSIEFKESVGPPQNPLAVVAPGAVSASENSGNRSGDVGSSRPSSDPAVVVGAANAKGAIVANLVFAGFNGKAAASTMVNIPSYHPSLHGGMGRAASVPLDEKVAPQVSTAVNLSTTSLSQKSLQQQQQQGQQRPSVETQAVSAVSKPRLLPTDAATCPSRTEPPSLQNARMQQSQFPSHHLSPAALPCDAAAEDPSNLVTPAAPVRQSATAAPVTSKKKRKKKRAQAPSSAPSFASPPAAEPQPPPSEPTVVAPSPPPSSCTHLATRTSTSAHQSLSLLPPSLANAADSVQRPMSHVMRPAIVVNGASLTTPPASTGDIASPDPQVLPGGIPECRPVATSNVPRLGVSADGSSFLSKVAVAHSAPSANAFATITPAPLSSEETPKSNDFDVAEDVLLSLKIADTEHTIPGSITEGDMRLAKVGEDYKYRIHVVNAAGVPFLNPVAAHSSSLFTAGEPTASPLLPPPEPPTSLDLSGLDEPSLPTLNLSLPMKGFDVDSIVDPPFPFTAPAHASDGREDNALSPRVGKDGGGGLSIDTTSSFPLHSPLLPHSPHSDASVPPSPLSLTKEEEEACTICLTAPRQVGFLHGKTSHLCVCRSCAGRLREGVHRCPMCRQLIERVIDIY